MTQASPELVPPYALDKSAIDLEKRRIALTAAASLYESSDPTIDVLESASQFYEWLNRPRTQILKEIARISK